MNWTSLSTTQPPRDARFVLFVNIAEPRAVWAGQWDSGLSAWVGYLGEEAVDDLDCWFTHWALVELPAASTFA